MDFTQFLTLIGSGVLIAGAVFLVIVWLPAFWDALAARQVADLAPRMRELNMDMTKLPFYLRLWGLSMLGSFLILWLMFGMLLVGIAAMILIYVLPRIVLQQKLDRRRTLLRDQMVGATTLLANATRAGLALAQGLEEASKECPEPLSLELKRMVNEFHLGRPLAEALRETQQRLDITSFTLFSNAILTCLERGGRVTEALDRISTSLQENQRLERKLEADTASGRKVVILLAVFPAVFLAGFMVLDPDQTCLLFETIVGQIVLVVVGLMVYFSVRWAQRIMNLQV